MRTVISSVAALSERRNRVEAGVSFATTHWSVVAQSALTHAPQAENALAKLCETYGAPIYSFIRRRGYSPADAQDLTQSFDALACRRTHHGPALPNGNGIRQPGLIRLAPREPSNTGHCVKVYVAA